MSLSHDETRRIIAENYNKLEVALVLIVKAQDDITLAKAAVVKAEEGLEKVKADIVALTSKVEAPIEEPVKP